MKKFWKRFTVIAAALCLVACMCGVFAACGDTDGGTYTLTVLAPDGAGVSGVRAKFCTVDEAGNELTCQMFTSDENGVIKAELDSANYHVAIVSGIPAGFAAADYMDGVSTLYTKNFTNKKYTITLTVATAE